MKVKNLFTINLRLINNKNELVAGSLESNTTLRILYLSIDMNLQKALLIFFFITLTSKFVGIGSYWA